MGAGDAQGVGVVAHDGPPGLGPLVDGDSPGHGPGDLRVAVVDGGGADHQVAVPQVVGVVADGHGNAQGAQALYGAAVVHVGALDLEALAQQHLRQGAHGHAADAHQVGPPAGDEVVGDGIGVVYHGGLPFQNRFFRCMGGECGI